MPERTRRTETLRPGAPVRVGSVTLVPVERVVVRAHAEERLAWCSASKEPFALIVLEDRGARAIGPDAAPIPLEDLRERVPGLDGLLAPA